MRKRNLLLIGTILLLFSACTTSKLGSNSADKPSGDEKPQGKKVPFLRTYYIGNAKYNPSIFEPQLNLDEALQVQYYLHGDIGVVGTLITPSQVVEVGVVKIGRTTDHITNIFKNGGKLVLVKIEGSIFILKGSVEGADIQLRFAPGNGNMMVFSPRNGKIPYGKFNFPVTPNSFESYLEIVVSRSRQDKSTNTTAEGISIEQGAPDNGDYSGGSNSDSGKDNGVNYDMPSSSEPSSPATETPAPQKNGMRKIPK